MAFMGSYINCRQAVCGDTLADTQYVSCIMHAGKYTVYFILKSAMWDMNIITTRPMYGRLEKGTEYMT